jgi:ABC-2 type transport system permease protein
MSTTTAAAEPAPIAEPAESLDDRPIPHAGWRVIAAKELGDHIISIRFMVLLILLGLAAATPLYFAADQIKSLAPQATGQQAVFLALFTIGSTDYSFLIVSSFVAIRRAAAGPSRSRSMRSTASEPRATLPRLVAQPIYRDDVINGKFVAGLSVILIVLLRSSG